MKRRVSFLIILLALFTVSASASLSAPTSAEVESDNPFFEGYDEEVVVFEFTGDRFQSDEITIQPEDINDRIQGEISEPITISISNVNTKAQYAVKDAGDEPIRRVDFLLKRWQWEDEYSWVPTEDERKEIAQQWAYNNCGIVSDMATEIPYRYYEKFSGFLGSELDGWAYCSRFDTIEAQIGELQSTPDVIMETSFQVEDASSSETVTITSGQSEGEVGTTTLETSSGESYAKINWMGGLESGFEYPVPVDEKVAFSNDYENNFRLIQRSEYDEQYPSILSEVDDKSTYEEWHNEYETAEGRSNREGSLENAYNNDILDVVQTYKQSEFFEYADSNAELFNGAGKLTDGVVEISGDRETAYPRFQVIVKAEEVGWTIPSADPVVEDVRYPDTFEEGSIGQVDIDVRNEGDGALDGSAYINSCTDEFTSLGTSRGVTVEPGETETVSVDVSFATGSYNSSTVSGSCDVHVKDLRSEEVITNTIELEGEQAPECTAERETRSITTEGEPIINPETGEETGEAVGGRMGIYICGGESLQRNLVVECAEGESISSENGELTCTDHTEEDDDGDNDDNNGGSGFLDSLFNSLGVDDPRDVASEQGFFSGILQTTHLGLALGVALVTGVVSYTAARWIDGERRSSGGFNPFASRGGRVEQGNIAIGVIAGLIGGLLGLGLGLGIPLGVQVIAIIVYLLAKASPLPI